MTQDQQRSASSSGRPENPETWYARLQRRLGAVSTTVVISGALVVGVTAIASAHDGPPTAHASARSIDSDRTNIPGERVYTNLQYDHVLGPVDYSGGPTPPVGGPHDPVWQNANGDVYDRPLRNEHAVHSLEHGVVWVTYAEDAPRSVVDAFRKKVEGVPYRMMSPVPGQDAPVKLTAWGRQLAVTSADDPRVDQFFEAYVQGPQAPEPEGPVTGGRAIP
ncbi:DUF3105 domain-containing protein [Streptomyces sp. NPDC087297]|uniref:DUF3105 domain-containing protein n=1 Tax=Streptomyces sp. NPDC087297 TaxID=3365778 RepID=UPI0037F9DB38